MPFSIQTNVNSLVAQENLRVNSNFQSQTIQRLTSGYRINQSGDDAAGLAIANKFRSDTAELTQGVRNANDGISTLQIIDGGMNNIGKMLDRLKTLATQSSSDTFTGGAAGRAVLNKEYQTLVNEIDRQAQGIGLSTGGRFAQSMGVYVGGGTTAGGSADTANGTIALDLANSVVDSKALGLRTSQLTVQSFGGTNLGAASSTSVGNIVNINGTSGSATASFQLSGAGFSGMKISVTLGTTDTTQTVADKLNSAIQAAGNAETAASKLLRAASIQANVVTDSSGNEQLTFTSASSAFQVTATTNTANALMGHFDAASTNAATGASVSQVVSGTATTVPSASGTAETVNLKVIVNGTVNNLTVALSNATTSAADAGQKDTDSVAANSILAAVKAAGLTTLNGLGVHAQMSSDGKLQFTGDSNQTIEVQSDGDFKNYLGLGSWNNTAQVVGNANAGGQTQAGVIVTITKNGVSNSLAAVNMTSGSQTDAATVLTQLQTAANWSTVTAGLTASVANNRIVFTDNNAHESLQVSVAGDTLNSTGLNAVTSSRTTAAAGTNNVDSATVGFSINGGQKILVSFQAGSNMAGTAKNFQDAINNNTELKAAGLTVDTTTLNVTSTNASLKFRVNVEAQSGTLNVGYGSGTNPGAVSAASFSATDKAAMVASSGASQTGLGTNNDVFSFAGLKNIGAGTGNVDQQVLSFSANDADGNLQSTSVTLSASGASPSDNIDNAIKYINTTIQNSGNATLKNIVAVKETNVAGTAEGIRFISSLNNFSVNVGQAANNTTGTPVGLYDGTAGATSTQGVTVTSSASGAVDISTVAGAQQAVTVLGQAVQKLGSAQAAIGKGQNQLNYAVTLANSQISNFSSAQAQIRDADVASEAANLSKAQVLQQASIAAMAQANSAPQAVLSLLRG